MSEYGIPMIRDGLCLKPWGNIAIEDFEKVQLHRPVLVTIKEPRNVDQLRKYWAIAQKVADFCDDFEDRYDADFWVRAKMRWMIKEIVLGDGRIGIRLKSISLAGMRQSTFNRYMDRALYLWAEKIKCDPETLLEQV